MYTQESFASPAQSNLSEHNHSKILEEASALSAYMNSQEQTLVATVASSALVSFLIPQCDYLNFLRSYYFTSTSGRAATSSEASAHHMDTLAERLTNAIILNQESTTKGGVVSSSWSHP